MLRRAKLTLRKFFAYAPNLRRISAAPLCGALDWALKPASFLSTQHIKIAEIDYL